MIKRERRPVLDQIVKYVLLVTLVVLMIVNAASRRGGRLPDQTKAA